MKQISLASSGFELSTKRTRKREFLDEMNAVIPWAALLVLLRRHAPESRMGRPPFALETMLRIHLLQQFFGLSDPAMEEALHDVPLYREFARLDVGMSRMPDESTILRFRHFLEAHQLGAALLATVNDQLSLKGLLLRQGTVVDATPIAAPSSTKNQSGQRDPDMPSKRRLLDSERLGDQLAEQIEQVKARIRAKVEHPFRVIKRQFGYVKTRYRGLAKNTQQILVLFALSNLWMVRKRAAMHQA